MTPAFTATAVAAADVYQTLFSLIGPFVRSHDMVNFGDEVDWFFLSRSGYRLFGGSQLNDLIIEGSYIFSISRYLLRQ